MRRLLLTALLVVVCSASAEEARDPSFVLSDCLGEYVTPRLLSEDTNSLVNGAFNACKTESDAFVNSYPPSMKDTALNNMREALIFTTDSRKRHAITKH